MNRAGFAVLLLLAISLPWAEGQQLPGGFTFATQDNRLSAIYVAQAMSAIRSGEWATAEGLIDAALQFDPSNSDALYERGIVLDQKPAGIGGAIAAFQAAIAAGRWQSLEPDACRLRLAGLLYRTKRYPEALAQLSAMSDQESAEWLFLTERSYAAEGKAAQAISALEGAIRAYPSDYRFVVDRVRFDPAYRERLAERYLKRNDIAYLPASVLEEIIVDTANLERKRGLIEAYQAVYGPSLTVLAESLMGAKSVADSALDSFVAQGGLEEGGLAEALYAALLPPKARAYLVAKAAAFTGTSSWDVNRDGYVERSVEYSSGRIVRLTVDDRQDGLPEYEIRFRDSIPYEATIDQDGTPFHIAYGEYPFVRSADYLSGGIKTIYTMAPGSFALPLLDPAVSAAGFALPSAASDPAPASPRSPALPTALLFPRIAPALPAVTPELLADHAYTVEADNLTLKRPVDLFKLGSDDVQTIEREWQQGSYRYLVEYRGKEKVLGLRDINDDGRYEVTERYRAGKLYELSYDPNQSSKPEFWINFGGAYPTLYWDYNQDGVPDAIERQLSATRALVEISTNMNGVYDVRFEEAIK